jgi:hypothetical protein
MNSAVARPLTARAAPAARLARALRAWLTRLATETPVTRLEAALRTGNTLGLEAAVPWPAAALVGRALLSETLGDVYAQAGVAAPAPVRVAKAATRVGDVGLRFDLTNPRALDWASTTSAARVTAIGDETRGAIRALTTRALREGMPPRTAATLIREVVGLTTRQAQQVANARAGWVAAGVPAAVVEARVARLAATLRTQRAELIARTETLEAQAAGQDEAWRQAEEAGLLDRAVVQEAWLVAEDERTCPECAPMADQRAPLGGWFTTGSGRPIQRPPVHPACRCTKILVEGSAPPEEPAPPTVTPPALPSSNEPAWVQAIRARIGDGLRTDTDAIAVGQLVQAAWDQGLAGTAWPRLTARVAAGDAQLRAWAAELTRLAWQRQVAGPGALGDALAVQGAGLTQLFRALHDTLAPLRAELGGIAFQTLPRVLGAIRPLGGVALRWAPRSHRAAVAALESVTPVLPRAWLDASAAAGPLRATVVARGAYRHGTATVQLPRRALVQGALHELGHRFELTVPGLRLLEQQFYARRTAGERLRPLAGYRGEWTRPDAFAAPYIGKDYGHRAYEILSMGQEAVYQHTLDGLAADPEHRAFVLGLLAGA